MQRREITATSDTQARSASSGISHASPYPGPSQSGKHLKQLPIWSLLVFAFILSITAGTIISLLHNSVDRGRQEEVIIGRIEVLSNKLFGLKWEAYHLGNVSSELDRQVQDLSGQLDNSMGELNNLDADKDIVPLVSGATKQYQSSVTQYFALLKAGKLVEAGQWDEKYTGPDYDNLATTVRNASDRARDSSNEASTAANIGTIIALGIAAILIGLLFRRFEHVRRVVDRMVGEQNALRHSEERFRSLIQHSIDFVSLLAIDGTILYQSSSGESILGYQEGTLLYRNLMDFIHPLDLDKVVNALTEELKEPGSSCKIEFRFGHANGSWIYLEAICSNLLDNPSVGGIVVNARDTTERKTLEGQLEHQAFHDPLTNLPNRMLFTDRLHHGLTRAARYGGSVAVLFLDLDNFKLVNDSLGHKAGDQLLIGVAQRLQKCLRVGDTIARLGGDEFTLLLEDTSELTEAVGVADRIAEQLHEPFYLEGQELYITCSIGIAMSVHEDSSPESLLRNADVALYAAKNKGKARYSIFEQRMDVRATERLQMESELRRAIERKEFRVFYQPVIDLSNGRISEVEALIRWEHPQRGLVPPAQFIPISEESGLIMPIGQLVLEDACRQVKEWHTQFPDEQPLVLSVNLSGRQLRNPRLVQEVAQVLRDLDFNPRYLKLEITESVAVDDEQSNLAMLHELRGLGIRLAIDDFGTGYSTLNYLKHCPVETLKIDRSFVDGLGQSQEDTAIVRAAIDFARALDLTVTGEGIETVEQLTELRSLGCHRGQGYYFSKPVPAEAMATLLVSAPDWMPKEEVLLER